MTILRYIFITLEVVLLFNLLIAVHELGHFLAAKWRGLKIERFAIWFGKAIWKRKINGVEYALGWIPAGGYVALPQMATMEIIEGKTEASETPLPNVSPVRQNHRRIRRAAVQLWVGDNFCAGRVGRRQAEQRRGHFHHDRLGGPERSGLESRPASGRHDFGSGRASSEAFCGDHAG